MTVPDKWKGSFPRILYTANPGNVGHMYFKSNFVDHGSFKVFRAPEDEGSMKRIYIPARLTDNKVLLANDPEYAQRVKGMGDSSLVKAMLEGDWDSLSIGGFSDIWRAHLHVIDAFDIPHTWKIDRGFDYGYSAPGAALWFAEADGEEFIDASGRACWVPKGTLFIINELYFANHKYEGIRLPASEQGKRIKDAEIDVGLSGRVRPGPADNSIFNREEGPSIADQLAISGIVFNRSNKSAGSRITGVELFRGRLQAVHNRPMEQPGIFIFRNCFHTIRTVPNLQNDEDKTEDISTTGEDHIWDVIRYRVLAAATKAGLMKVEGA
jgi:hypothetical protein